ncbi:hypothetical protein LCGC14_2807390 [marine sediment metagenome]|uniref:Uncharacterized protein n=1 Tax=marine sediment metagenome TaxID=412755 RepID=A0A0F8YKY0_9ZZZZ
MANQGQNTVVKFKFKGFENVEFSAEERDRVQDWIDKFGEPALDAAVVLVESAYKIGMSYDSYHGVNQVTITCHDKNSRYYGYCFTFKHADLGKAILIFRFMYDHYLKDELYVLGGDIARYDW